MLDLVRSTLFRSNSQPLPILTHKNHFQFGYDGQAFHFRKNPDQQWFVSYGACSSKPLDFKKECLRTAELIKQQAKAPVHVMFSGGVDSEVALRSFVEAGIPVTAAILRFKNDLNIHDISWAVLTCEALKVPYRFYELDVLDFWKNRIFDYAEKTYCVTPQLLPTMWLADQIDGYPVMGSGECLFVKEVPVGYQPGISPYEKSDWFLWEKEKIASWYRHFMIYQRDACPGFFQYTPEIMLSYLLDPLVQELISDRIIGKLTTESSKLKIYQQHFDLITRPKYTGFEKIQNEDAFYRKILRESFPGCDQVHKTKVADLQISLSSN